MSGERWVYERLTGGRGFLQGRVSQGGLGDEAVVGGDVILGVRGGDSILPLLHVRPFRLQGRRTACLQSLSEETARKLHPLWDRTEAFGSLRMFNRRKVTPSASTSVSILDAWLLEAVRTWSCKKQINQLNAASRISSSVLRLANEIWNSGIPAVGVPPIKSTVSNLYLHERSS